MYFRHCHKSPKKGKDVEWVDEWQPLDGRGKPFVPIPLLPFYGKRTADVDTITDVRLLRITRETLERLRRRYPRIGGQVLLNLSEILAGRVASTIDQLG